MRHVYWVGNSKANTFPVWGRRGDVMLLRRTWNLLIVMTWGREGPYVSGFSVPAFQDPPWFYLLFSPWVTTFLPSFIFRANSLGPLDASSCLIIYLFPFLSIWEPSLRRRGVMTSLAYSVCTGVSWGPGFPLPASLSECIYGGRWESMEW